MLVSVEQSFIQINIFFFCVSVEDFEVEEIAEEPP